ncbi:MAG TPA: winged helix-turn-helix domain-containing protein [Thermoanaerobaculia bacterium]|jgi:TolB-like protein
MFRFGEYQLDLDRYELRRGGDVVKTEPRVLELLHYLIEQRERVVPKEELLDTVWGGTIVSESALTSTIRDARRALADSPTEPRWIKTVYGRGLRFVGDIASEVAPPPKAAPVAKSTSRKSIAVLPFTDLSAHRDQQYFCDGIAEELINALTRLEELRVVSRATAFDFRSDDDVRILGERLGVDYILRGSVRKSEERLRITVHVVDVATGHHVWSEKYDRTVGDIFALQEEIAENTARAILGVVSDRNRRAMKSTPVRLDAYEFYLKGRTYLAQGARTSLESAVSMFEIAIDFDHDYAPAWAGLADALAELYVEAGDEALLQRAAAASERAVELAPNLSETHVCRGHVLTLSTRHRDAAVELELALAINDRASDAHYRYGRLRMAEGKLAEAAERFERAWQLQPTDYHATALLAQVYQELGRKEEARAAASRTVALCTQHLERKPDDVRAVRIAAGALRTVGDPRADEWDARM